MRQVKKTLKEQQKQQQKRPKKDCPQGKASSTVTFLEKELIKFAQRFEKMAMILQQMTSTMHGCKYFIQQKVILPLPVSCTCTYKCRCIKIRRH